jgi:hypothetical protein
MVERMLAVLAAMGTRNANFSQIARLMSAGISASMPAATQAASSASTRGLRRLSNSPKISFAIVPVCAMTPGLSITAPI